jgi:hypothetical protein
MVRKQAYLLCGVFLFTALFSGCAYLKNRGNDALDMFDLGITVSKKPGFALYMDKPPIMPMGFANVEGKLIGLGRSRFGVHDFREKGVGYFVGGSLQRGLDNYDVQDANAPARYDTGLLGYLKGTTAFQTDLSKDEEGRPKTRATCPLTVHLGWVGFEWGCKFWDMLDFMLGWTTLDIGHDDEFTRSGKKEAAKSEGETPHE